MITDSCNAKKIFVAGTAFFCLLLFIIGVFSYFAKSPDEKLRLEITDVIPRLTRVDFDGQALSRALTANIGYLERLPSERKLFYGNVGLKVADLLRAQLDLLTLLATKPDLARFQRYLERHFQIYTVAPPPSLWGGRNDSPVLFTGYYVPTLRGARHPDERFRFPLYRRPDDLVNIDFEGFDLQRRIRRLWPWIDRIPLIPGIESLHFPRRQGRLRKDKTVVPYYTREEVDYQGKLAGRGLELLWVDDETDRFFLQIQGSGRILMADGGVEMVGYAAANGHPYRSVGAWLIRQGLMRREEVSMPAIRAWIDSHPQRRREIFSVNPSYVFFRSLPGKEPLGCLQIPLTANCSIAVDRRVYPEGALALIDLDLPEFAATGEATGSRSCRRLVLTQDTGGAIRGPYRVDLYCGADRRAELVAGVMKQPGRLFFLLPR
ncbi:MAG: transglycosylase [Deltaproteobacteria bacterium]|nr:transglycosylase [Deltaproteobacteria bacterium]